MINPNPAKIEDILNTSCQFFVPKYQREYTWGKSEAIEFMDDLKSYAEPDGGNLFLGTIIFDNSEEKLKKIKVVDGQQRITTVLLLLIACRNAAKAINEVNIATLIQNKITFIDPTTAESLGCRLVASESIKQIFEEISKYDWNGNFQNKVNGRSIKRQVNRIKPIYDFFYEEISGFDKTKLSNFLKAIYNTYVVRIDIQDEIEAFSIFERTNARGVDLEASDLLKNYLFARGADGVEENWPVIIDNADGTILRMLKYFYVAKNGYVTQSELYKKIRSYGNNVGANQLLVELGEFSRYYKDIRTANALGIRTFFEDIKCSAIASDQNKYEKIHIALEGLRLFKIFQIYPLIYSAISCFIKSGGNDNPMMIKRLVALFELLEKYHFINNAVCERIGNEVEKLYASFCIKYNNSTDFEKTTEELVTELKEQLADEDEFVSRFTDITYSSEYIPLISYIFDRINNFGLHPGQRIQLFNPDPKILRKNHNIEHFYPQTPDGSMTPDQETTDAVDNIGNLLSISFRTNSKLSNMSPKAKIEKLKTDMNKEIQNLNYVRDFIEEWGDAAESWDKTKIAQRAEKMARLAYREIWKLA